MATQADKRKAATDLYLEAVKVIDQSGKAYKFTKAKLDAMSDKEFHKFMLHLREGTTRTRVMLPNTQSKIDMEKIVKFATKINCELESRLIRVDPVTKLRYMTPHKGVILRLCVRRQIQTEDNKLSVSEGARHMDNLTGQVTGPDKACSISMVEIQSMLTKNLHNCLTENVVIKGGNVPVFAKYKEQLEENGTVNSNALPMSATRARSGIMFSNIYRGMYLENNF